MSPFYAWNFALCQEYILFSHSPQDSQKISRLRESSSTVWPGSSGLVAEQVRLWPWWPGLDRGVDIVDIIYCRYVDI